MIQNRTQVVTSKIIVACVVSIFLFSVVCFSNEERTRSEKHFAITQNMYTRLDTYKKELINLSDDYLYQENRLPIDELMLQLFPVFIEAIDKTRHNVWTVNRLLYMEIFHEKLDQYSPRAVEVITTYIKTTIDFISTDISSLEEIPHKAPSLTDIPLLLKHYNKTINHLQLTKTKLHEVLTEISPNNITIDTSQHTDEIQTNSDDKGTHREPLHL